MKEFLRSCADIPYNSASADLPDAYNDHRTWGLDCVGFAKLVVGAYPNFQMISGLYGTESVHMAAIAPSNRSDHLYYVDAFLRMKEPLPVRRDVFTEVETHFEGFVISGKYDSANNMLSIALQRRDRCHSKYTFCLGTPLMHSTPHRYRYSVLHEGRPVTVEKQKRVGGTTSVAVKGAEETTVETVLQKKFGIGIQDVALMFFYAEENSRYNRFQMEAPVIISTA